MKEHGDAWKTSDEVLDLVNALSKPGDALKKIKEIRSRQKSEPETGDGAVSLTVGRAIEFLKAAIKDAGKLPEQDAYGLFCDTIRLGDTWAESGFTDDILNGWMEKYEKAVKLGVAPHLEV